MIKRGCAFCSDSFQKKSFLKGEKFFAVYDGYPLSKGHTLVIPYAHKKDIWSLNFEEWQEIYFFLKKVKKILAEKYSPDGYNIGINCGKQAGQTIFHLHIHIIPRFKGDQKDPRGGIRKIFIEKCNYWDKML